TPATRLIIVNTPANPTGGAIDKKELDTLAAGLADRPDIAILSDEIYSRMVYDGQTHTSLLSYPEIAERVILLDGWSKTFAMTGWRLGFAVWPRPLVDHAIRLAVNSHSCVNASAQFAGIAALEGPQDAVATMVSAFSRRRRLTVDRLNALPGIRCAEPGGAFYAFPNIEGTGISSIELQSRLLEQAGIATVSGTAFGAFGEGYLRLSYAASLTDIERAMERFADLLA
ncbi:MAG: aminotransferase class I/II-fold pyridoxal phosphate-dependent enzyme, partial [Pseudomonadota bacterium]